MDLVKMIRPVQEAKGGPTEADVHPDEVQNYTLGGWVPVQDDPTEVKGKMRKKEAGQ